MGGKATAKRFRTSKFTIQKVKVVLSAIYLNFPNLLDIITISQLNSFGEMTLLTELNKQEII
jgi:hypothetical protein